MIELTLKDLEKLKMHSPPPRHVGDERRFAVFPKAGLTMFKDFHALDKDALERTDHAMIGVLTPEGLRWSVECKVIL